MSYDYDYVDYYDDGGEDCGDYYDGGGGGTQYYDGGGGGAQAAQYYDSGADGQYYDDGGRGTRSYGGGKRGKKFYSGSGRGYKYNGGEGRGGNNGGGDYNNYGGDGYGGFYSNVGGNSYNPSTGGGGGTYVDNSMNRPLGHTGFPQGSAVHSNSANSSSYLHSNVNGSRSGTYVDHQMNRSSGHMGLLYGSAVHSNSVNSSSYLNSNGNGSRSGTYVDNQLNRSSVSSGHVGLLYGSAVQTNSINSGSYVNSNGGGSNSGTYVDNRMNMPYDRAGLPHGTAVQSNSFPSGHSVAEGWGSSSNNAVQVQVYGDNAYNRRLGRVGLPLEAATVFSSPAPERRYVDKPMNRRLGRVGMIVGTQPVAPKPPASTNVLLGVDRIYGPLVGFDPEDDNLGDITMELHQLRDEVRALKGNREKELQCEIAIGIVNRHEAALAKYQNKLKVPDWVRGGQVIPFESLDLWSKIGGGGFGDVHMAFWNGNVAAVKKLRVQRVSQAKKEEFQMEVQVFSQLDHPAIVKFFGVCTTSPNLAIVMEFMGGGSMHDILHIEQRVLSTTQKEQMITDCLEALKYLHARNVTHRNIKSMNILICDDYEHCKLGDFGLAMKEDAKVSSSVAYQEAMGTLPYSPPEVIEGRRLKPEELKCVDVYSMGIVIVEFLTKRIPFKGLNPHPIRQSITNGLRPNVESISDVSLKTLLEITMSQEPERRPSARMFLRKWEELELIGSMNRMSIVDVNASDSVGSSGGIGGLSSNFFNATAGLNSSSESQSSSASSSTRTSTNSESSSRRLECPMCLENTVNTAFVCGHLVCDSCLPNLTKCPLCRGSVRNPIRIYV